MSPILIRGPCARNLENQWRSKRAHPNGAIGLGHQPTQAKAGNLREEEV